MPGDCRAKGKSYYYPPAAAAKTEPNANKDYSSEHPVKYEYVASGAVPFFISPTAKAQK